MHFEATYRDGSFVDGRKTSWDDVLHSEVARVNIMDEGRKVVAVHIAENQRPFYRRHVQVRTDGIAPKVWHRVGHRWRDEEIICQGIWLISEESGGVVECRDRWNPLEDLWKEPDWSLPKRAGELV
jgi:hypothetical protein